MDTTLCLAPDKQENWFVQSKLVSILWTKGAAFAGFKTEFEVKTSHIDTRTQIKVTCWTEKGKLLDTIQGHINFNRYRGKIFIPFTIKSDNRIYLEVELPEYGITQESDSIPIRSSIHVTTIKKTGK